jgi:hypothetical protein
MDSVELKERETDPKCCCCVRMETGISLAATVGFLDTLYMLGMALAGFLFYSVGKS